VRAPLLLFIKLKLYNRDKMKTPTYKIELQSFADGYTHVAGIDEVGRGCLAGPVVAAVVALDPESIGRGRAKWYGEVRDSKLVSPEKRFMLEPLIKEHSFGWGVGVVNPQSIDAMNIHHATLLAMSKAVTSFTKALERFDAHGTKTKLRLLIDGRFTVPDLLETSFSIDQSAIVDGDALVLSISAASILAKTYRDRFMVKLNKKFPAYEFARHKGYATELHRRAIRKHGLTAVHRVSFCGNMV
jgi:ribonuclease HII